VGARFQLARLRFHQLYRARNLGSQHKFGGGIVSGLGVIDLVSIHLPGIPINNRSVDGQFTFCGIE
jgi:hypothetical protein